MEVGGHRKMRRPQIGKMAKKKYRTPLLILLGCVSL